ncbi:MAG: SRPBCC domain-containing protein [Rubrivivax sp.]
MTLTATNQAANPATYTLGRGMELERDFAAPPDMLFQAWTEPEYLEWFFNPGFAAEPPSVDLRVGGQWRQLMIENPQKSYFTGGLYREIARPSRLVFNWGAVGGWPELDPADPDQSPRVTLTFRPLPGGARMKLRVDFPDQYTEERVDWWMNCGMVEGWNITIGRLEAALGRLSK